MAENAPRDQNFVPAALFQIDGEARGQLMAGQIDENTGRILVDTSGGAGGTVTTVSVVTANGFAGTVANATTTPAITLTTTITGILSGNGTAISAASTTGSGAVVLANTPTLTTPVIGAATGTSLSVTGLLSTATGLTLEETGAGTDTITFQAPASIAASYTLTFPVDDGNSGEVLSTNGSGVLSWVSAGGVPTTITVANEATDTSCFLAFFTAATGDLGPKTNVNMTFDSNTGVATFASTVLTTTDINGGTIDGTTIGGSSAAAITGTTITGNSFIPNSNSVPSNGMYLPAANTLGWAINSSAELQLTSTALSPAADGGSSLGTTALGWQNLFSNTGFVWNIENGDWVATHTSGILTVTTGDLRVTSANVGTNADSVPTLSSTSTLTNKTLTSPTITTANLSGAQQLAEGASMRLDASLSADGTYSGWTISGTAGTTLAFGDLIYKDPTDSRWELADANSAQGADGDSRGTLGICVLAAAADGDPTVILLWGNVRADTAFPTMTVNNQMYVSETAGDITGTQPTTTDVVIRVVGVALGADELLFNPSPDFITHT